MAFLAAVGCADGGFVGGLLVANHLGRPLEFQCTAPVKPNRTQEILYGPTLVPYILCDLIGRTLIEKIGITPHLVLVDDPVLLGLREQVDVPIGCIESPGSRVEGPGEEPVANADTGLEGAGLRVLPSHSRLRLGSQFVRLHSDFAVDIPVVEAAREQLPSDANLCEPFSRVREALSETMGVAA